MMWVSVLITYKQQVVTFRKQCGNGVTIGQKVKTRECVGGNVGDLGCSDSNVVEITEEWIL